MIKYTFYKYLAFGLVSIGLGLSGCSDDDIPNPAPGGNTQKSMSAVVNGIDWEASGGNYRLGSRVISNGASAFVETGDTLTIIGVQVQGTDTTAILLSIKLDADKVGSYRLRSGTSGDGKAYFLNGLSEASLRETKEKYDGGITNGELRVSQYDVANYRVSGSFGFSMAATGETTYTVVAGEIANVTF